MLTASASDASDSVTTSSHNQDCNDNDAHMSARILQSRQGQQSAASGVPDSSKINSANSSADISTDCETLPVSISARLGKLQFHRSGKFRVLQFADLQDVPSIAKDTITLMESALDAVRPDIVIFTGNQIAGYEKVFSSTFRRRRWEPTAQISDKEQQRLLQAVNNHIERMIKPLENRSIPWAVTYGNHDFQCGLDVGILDELYRQWPGCLNPPTYHNEMQQTVNKNSLMPRQSVYACEAGTFALPVLDENQQRVIFSLVVLNSGDYAQTGGYGSPCQQSLQFLRRLPTLLPAPYCVFQHFPIQQYYTMLREVSEREANAQHAVEGYRNFQGRYFTLNEETMAPDSYLGEGVSCPDADSGEYDILTQTNAFMLVAGHDHRNAFAGTLETSKAPHSRRPLLLVATPTCGFGSYGPAAAQRGVRLFEFDIRHPFEPRTQMLEFGALVGKPSSRKAYTYGSLAESEHDLPKVDLLRKPSLLKRLIHRMRSNSDPS